MSAETTLLATYQEWHRLAEAEGKAIGHGNWNFLLECQSFIQKLQPLISKLTGDAVIEWQKDGADLIAKKKQLSQLAFELIALEQENQVKLMATKAAAKLERAQLEQTRQNLKRLQQSYIVARPAAWSSFS